LLGGGGGKTPLGKEGLLRKFGAPPRGGGKREGQECRAFLEF